MANTKISDESPVTLVGGAIVPVVQSGVNGRTTAQAIADLAQTYVNNAIAVISTNGDVVPDGVAVGCGIAYSGTGLTFNMSAGTYYIDGTLYTATAQSVTLAAADASNPRIDVLYIDSTGTFGKITGTAAATPSQPTIDPTTQLYLTFVQVPATATSITGITNESIYLEGTEWTPTTSGSGFTANSTNNPHAGTKDIEGTAVTAGSYVKLVRSSSMTFDGDGNLLLYIRSKAAWNAKRWLTLRWYLAGIAKGSAVSLKSGSFAFDSSVTASYQLIVIPKTLFSIPSGTSIDQLRIEDVGGSIGFYLDDIVLQNTGTSSGGGTTSGITQEQADARYLKLTGGTISGDLSVPEEAYDATAWNGSLEVPTKNAIRDKIETLAVTATERARVIPTASIFTPQNLGTSTTTDVSTGVLLTVPNSAINVKFLRHTAGPASFTSFTMIWRCQPMGLVSGASYTCSGFLRNSGSSKIIILSTGYQGSSQALMQRWSSYAAFSANIVTPFAYVPAAGYPWQKAVVAAGTLTYSVSPDGIAWVDVGTEAIATYITSIDEVGVGVMMNSVGSASTLFQSFEIA